MDKTDIYQKKLIKYQHKYLNNNKEIYHEKIKLYSNLSENSQKEIFNNLKFYYTVLKFFDLDIIKNISEFNKVIDNNYQQIFDNIKNQLGDINLNIRYVDEYRNIKNFSSDENISQLIKELSDKHSWANALSKIILWKILYLYDFNRLVCPKIKEFCQININTLLLPHKFYI